MNLLASFFFLQHTAMRTAGRTCSGYKNGRKKRPNGWMGNISPMKQVNGGSDARFIHYLQIVKLCLSTFFVSVCFRISRAEPNCTRLLQCMFLFKNRQGHWHCTNNRSWSPYNSGVWEPDDCCITFHFTWSWNTPVVSLMSWSVFSMQTKRLRVSNCFSIVS